MKAQLFAVMLTCVVGVSVVMASAPSPSEVSDSVKQLLPKINLNTADAATLTHSFKGIGKKRAEAIVAHRAAEGAYKSVADLSQVRGLGESFVSTHLSELEARFSVS